METLSKQQQLFVWKADVIGSNQKSSRTDPSESRKLASPEKDEECSEPVRQKGNICSPDRTQSEANCEPSLV